MNNNKRTTKQIIADQQAINRKLWAKENGRLHHVDANKLIAEFMGVPNVGTNSRPIFDYGEMVGCRSLEDLHYHHAWNWLMPVVQKIMDVSFFNGEPEDFYVVRDCIPEVSDTYKEVVEFIKKYNNED